MEDARVVALLVALAVAPVTLVIVVAVLRGYTIDVHMTRPGKHRREDD